MKDNRPSSELWGVAYTAAFTTPLASAVDNTPVPFSAAKYSF